MMNKMKRLILACLSSQLLLATAIAPAWAREDEGAGDNTTVPNQADNTPDDGQTGDPDPGNPSETPPADSSSSETPTNPPQNSSSESSAESSQASSESTQKSTEGTQHTPAPIYPQPVYPPAPNDVDHSTPPISITDPKPEETTKVQSELDWSAIVQDSLQDPIFARAFEDYQYALATYNFDSMDPMNSLLSDVQADFETYLIEGEATGSESEEADTESSVVTTGVQTPGELEEMGEYSLLSYHYGQDTPAPIRLQFVFVDSSLQAISLVQEAQAESRAIDESEAAQLSSGETMVEELADMNLPVVGLSHHVDQGLALDSIVVPHVRDEAQDYLWLNVIGGMVSTATSPANEEDSGLGQQMTTFLIGNPDVLASESSEASELNSDESQDDETSDESIDSQEEMSEDSSSAEESSAEETVDQSNHPILSQVPLDFSYDESKLLGVGSLRQGFETMMASIKEGQEVNRETVQSWLGQPTVESEAGSSTTQKYLAIADDKVLYIQVISETESGKIQEIKTDNRTARLFDVFPLKVDDLYNLAEDNAQIYNNISKKLGDPTIVEFKPDTQQIRYVWTSFEDKAMKNIEVVEDLNSKQFDLLYYEP